jgi:hypothetical protein
MFGDASTSFTLTLLTIDGARPPALLAQGKDDFGDYTYYVLGASLKGSGETGSFLLQTELREVRGNAQTQSTVNDSGSYRISGTSLDLVYRDGSVDRGQIFMRSRTPSASVLSTIIDSASFVGRRPNGSPITYRFVSR